MLSEIDLLITEGQILTLDNGGSIIDSGDIAIRDGIIIEFGQDLKAKYQSSYLLAANGKLVMPGLVNAHVHCAMSLFRGLADDLPLMDWLMNYIFPAETRFMDAERVYLGTILACLEMIKSGVTTVADGYFFEGAAAKAVADAGLRGIMGQGIIDFPCPDASNSEQGLHLAENFINEWRSSDLITPAIFCHSAYTCSPETLQKARKIAQKYSVPFFIHLAETKAEVEQINGQYGKRPVEHLAELGILDEMVVAVHCIWLSPEEIWILQKSGVKVVHAPQSNMKLASGIAPIPDLLKQKIVVGLGTDGAASNNDLDLFLEMDTAAKLHKVALGDPSILRAEDIVRMATTNGARVLGLYPQIGSLGPGQKADLIIIDLKKPHLQPLYNLYSHLVYTVGGSDVDSVIVNGKLLMENRRVLTLNEDEILDEVISLAPIITKKLK